MTDITSHQDFIPFLYEKELQNSKKLLDYNFSKQDIIDKPSEQFNGQQISIFASSDSFNDLVLIVKLNSNDKIELHKLIMLNYLLVVYNMTK